MAIGLQNSRGSRVADQAIYDAVGVADLAADEDYYKEAASYHLGLLFAHANEPEIAAEYFANSHTHPSSSGDLVFPEHLRLGLEFYAEQRQAAERGVPSILISAMPRSASASLSATLARSLGIPTMGISKGRFPDYWIAPCWLMLFNLGGAVTHDHFRATPFNLRALRDTGCRDVFVQIRDPRAAAASLIRHQDRSFNLPVSGPARDPFEAHLVERCLASYYPWLEDWLDVAAEERADLRVHWVMFDDVRRDIAATVQTVLDVLGYAPVPPIEHVTMHMVRGEDDAWREGLSQSAQQKLWDAMPRRAIDLLELSR